MSKELTQIGQICGVLDTMEGTFAQSLEGTGISAKRFLTTAKTAVQTHADPEKLASATRNSLFLAIRKAAGDGLMPDGREAALVVYNTKQKDGSWKSQVQYQPMVQGLIKLARKSGEISKLGAYIVYSKDNFSYRTGDDIPDHQADWFSEDRGDPIGVWAFVKLKSGDYIDPVMLTKERINRIASRSKMAKNYDPKLGKDWEEFWKKAAIRNVLKLAPKSTVLDQSLDANDKEFTQGETIQEPPTEVVQEEPRTETRASEGIKAKADKKPEPEVTVVEAEVVEVQSNVEEIPV